MPRKETEYVPVSVAEQLDVDDDGSDDTNALTDETGDDYHLLAEARRNAGKVIEESLG